MLVLQRTWVQFPTPTWQFTTICNFNSVGFNALFPKGTTHTRGAHRQNIHNINKTNKIKLCIVQGIKVYSQRIKIFKNKQTYTHRNENLTKIFAYCPPFLFSCCVCMWFLLLQSVCGGQRTVCRSCYHVRSPGMELGASVFTVLPIGPSCQSSACVTLYMSSLRGCLLVLVHMDLLLCSRGLS